MGIDLGSPLRCNADLVGIDLGSPLRHNADVADASGARKTKAQEVGMDENNLRWAPGGGGVPTECQTRSGGAD